MTFFKFEVLAKQTYFCPNLLMCLVWQKSNLFNLPAEKRFWSFEEKHQLKIERKTVSDLKIYESTNKIF